MNARKLRPAPGTGQKAVIAIDLGGTKIASALFTGDGKLSHHAAIALSGRKGNAVAALIKNQIARLQSVARKTNLMVEAVGISVPGVAYAQSGTVWAPNIPGWKNYRLKREIEEFLGRKPIHVVVDNDRACSILGEVWQGAAKGCQHAIFLAVGTGIGAGILIDGKVLRGADDIAGSVGWMALDRPFRPEYVSCGCFEHHASGEGLAKTEKELLAKKQFSGLKHMRTPPTAREILSAHDRNDPLAKAVVKEAIPFWGMAVANLVSMFNPEKIIFGGGVFGPAKKLLPAIHSEAKKWAQPIAIKQMKLLASKLGPNATLYGTGYIALTSTCASENKP